MRIISGALRGKPIESPKNHDIRPTSDRTREALFNLLVHMDDNPIIDQRVMDICCGTGALGLEALSRGASHCTFIDNNRDAIHLTERNIASMGMVGKSETIQVGANQLPHAKETVALVMMDPPYQHESIVEQTLASLRDKGWVKAGSLISIEQPKKRGFRADTAVEILKQRSYGKSEITILRVL